MWSVQFGFCQWLHVQVDLSALHRATGFDRLRIAYAIALPFEGSHICWLYALHNSWWISVAAVLFFPVKKTNHTTWSPHLDATFNGSFMVKQLNFNQFDFYTNAHIHNRCKTNLIKFYGFTISLNGALGSLNIVLKTKFLNYIVRSILFYVKKLILYYIFLLILERSILFVNIDKL